MKKVGLSLIIMLAVLVGGWFLLRVTGVFTIYKIPTGSNEPNIKAGQFVLVSNIKDPEIGDMVVFKRYDSFSKRKVPYVYRLLGKPGDKVEITDGVLFVNGEDADRNLKLNHNYSVPSAYADKLQNISGLNMYSLDSEIVLEANPDFLADHNVEGQRIILDYHEMVENQFGEEWGPDTFGPIVVPKGHFSY